MPASTVASQYASQISQYNNSASGITGAREPWSSAPVDDDCDLCGQDTGADGLTRCARCSTMGPPTQYGQSQSGFNGQNSVGGGDSALSGHYL